MRETEAAPACGLRVERREVELSGENWHEERDRLVQLLQAIESGRITRMDEGDLPELQATTPQNVAVLKVRVAQLNARLGDRQAENSTAAKRAPSTASEPDHLPPDANAT